MVCVAIDDRAKRRASGSRPLTLVTPVTPADVIGKACLLSEGIESPERSWEALLRSDDDESLVADSRPELTEASREVADRDPAYRAAETWTRPTG